MRGSGADTLSAGAGNDNIFARTATVLTHNS